MRKLVEKGASRLGLRLDGEQIEGFIDYSDMLAKANTRFNLLSRRTANPADILQQHLMDSLRAVNHLRGRRIADVGSGAGLPGIPLAIARPDCRMILMERASRRCDFLRLVKTRLGLGNVEVIECDARDLDGGTLFDTALARALTRPAEALALLLRLVHEQGRVVLFCGQQRFDVPESQDGRTVRLLRPANTGTRP